MMDSPIEEIKNKLDIVEVIGGYINLKKGGKDYKACCPFHSEKTPSFFVSPSKQIWHCFGCGLGGDMFSFVMQIEGIEFADALRNLAQKAGVVLKKQDPKLRSELSKLSEICQEASRFFQENLSKNKKAKEYLRDRGLLAETIKDFSLGYANDSWDSLYKYLTELGYKSEEIEKAGLIIKSEKSKSGYYDRFRDRIIFPIADLGGRIVGFTGRIIKQGDGKQAKYVNSPETPLFHKSEILYGLDKAKVEIRQKEQCILVEGQMDLILSHQSGVKNAVATSGTALTSDHLKIIKRYTDNLLFAFDTDSAGEKATRRSINLAQRLEFNIGVISLGSGKDPAEIIQKNPKTWTKAIDSSESIMEFYFAKSLAKYSTDEIEDKRKIVQELLPPIKRIANKIEQAHWLQMLSFKLDIKEELLAEALKKVKIAGEEKANTSSTNQSKAPLRSRLAYLEENLLGFALKEPQYLPRIKKNLNFNYLTTELVREIFKALDKNKNQVDLVKLKKELLKNQSYYLDHLLFQIEHYYDLSSKEIAQEIDFYIKEIKKDKYKKELGDLSLQIKKNERLGEKEAVKKLTAEFNKLSHKITNL